MPGDSTAENAASQAGAKSRIVPTSARAESETPEIATFEHEDGDSYVVVRALSPGTAALVLRNAASGDVLERVGIDVAAIQTVAPSYPTWESRVLVMEGGSMTIGIDLLDEAGCRLVGVGAAEYALEGGISEEQVTLVSALADWLVSLLVGSVDEYITAEATALGEGTLTATATGGASLELSFSVVDESSVDSVSLVAPEGVEVGSAFSVSATATTADGERVHSPACAWTFTPTDAPIEVVSSSRDAWSFQASAPTTFSVGCTVGAAHGEVEVVVP
jgi:hypothetical protein